MGILLISKKAFLFVIVAFTVGVVVSGFIFGLMFYTKNAYSGFLSTSLVGVFPPEELKGAAGESARAPSSTYSQLETVGRMMIYTARLGLKVRDIDSAIDGILDIAQDLGGDVSEISTSREGERRTGTVTLRVPQEDFYSAIEAIENLGEVESKDVEGEDVTEKYVDLSARLSNLQKQEQRLTEILGMAATVEDVLKVEAELNRVRGQIEQITGQIQYLENRVELATITVLLSEQAPWIMVPEVDWGNSIEAGLWGVFMVFQGLIALAIVTTPFIAIGTPIYLVYKRRQTRSEVSA